MAAENVPIKSKDYEWESLNCRSVKHLETSFQYPVAEACNSGVCFPSINGTVCLTFDFDPSQLQWL